MGLRGPPKKPTVLRLAGGNTSKRKSDLDTREVVPPAGVPTAPEWLSESALAIYNQLAPDLARVGLARTIDGYVLGRYCELLARWIALVAEVRKGTTYAVTTDKKDKAGKVTKKIQIIRELPQAKEWRQLGPQLTALEREFGLTPASRTRIRIEQEAGVKGDVNELKRKFFERPAS